MNQLQPLNQDYHADKMITSAKSFKRRHDRSKEEGKKFNWNVLMDIQSLINEMEDLKKNMDDTMDKFHDVDAWIQILKGIIKEDG
jgi:hypothetical protein